MPQDTKFSFETLEWEKICGLLARNMTSDLGAQQLTCLVPSCDPAEIVPLLDINTECREIIETKTAFPLEGCCDVSRTLRKLSKAGMYLSPGELNTLAGNCEVAQRMKTSFGKAKTDFPGVYALVMRLQPHDDVIRYVRQKIDEDGDVRDSASPALARLRRKIHQLGENLRKRLQSLAKQYADSGFLQEEHVTIKNGRFVLPVRESRHRNVTGITHGVSSSGATLFVEPIEIVERNNEINRLKVQEEDEIRRVLSDVSGRFRAIIPSLEQNQSLLARLDFHHAVGKLGKRLSARKPHVSPSESLKLIDARHPLLLVNAGDASEVVPLNLTLGESFRTLVISGPNAGGKTVALKTIGLLCLMVQCGLPVPVSPDSHFPVFRRIIAEIGDPQSLDDNLSTFSARLLNIKDILDHVSGNDLILLDELGTGTDPQEGISLAMAVMSFLMTRGALSVVTTHHGGLKIFASETPGMENASLAFDEQSLQPTFQLSVGIPGSSYALELSRKIGLPDDIIAETRERIGGAQLKVEDYIRELESRTAFYKKKNSEIEEKIRNLDKLIADYTERVAHLQEEYREKLETALGESEERLTQFNRRFEHLVREIRQKGAPPESIKKAKELLKQETEHIKKTRRKQERASGGRTPDTPPREISVGSTVQMTGSRQTGIVIAENPRKNTVTVQMESLKLAVPKDRVIAVSSRSRRKRSAVHAPVISVTPEIDLRGLSSQEAAEKMDEYLSNAIATGLTSVRIIHGKGTGTLRARISEFLKNDDRVAVFRLGGWGEGDTGVTIAELK